VEPGAALRTVGETSWLIYRAGEYDGDELPNVEDAGGYNDGEFPNVGDVEDVELAPYEADEYPRTKEGLEMM
jgi:hypothetical protein